MLGSRWGWLFCGAMGILIGWNAQAAQAGPSTDSVKLAWHSMSPPTPRSDYGFAAFGGKLWVFGGSEANHQSDGGIWWSNDGRNWDHGREDAAFGPRQGQTVTEFKGALWTIGGYSQVNGSAILHRDIWRSTDGLHWEAMGDAEFTSRTSHACVVLNDRMYVIGGVAAGGSLLGDVWSSADGVHWSEETAAASFGGRAGFGCTVLNGKIWVSGGLIDNSAPDIAAASNVWSSSDGKNWTKVSDNSPFGARSGVEMAAWNDRLWLAGGIDVLTTPTTGHHYSHDDLWSSADGTSWTQVTAEMTGTERTDFRFATFNGGLWLYGGMGQWPGTAYYGYAYGPAMGDVWRTVNGPDWIRADRTTLYPPRFGAATAVFNDEMWVIGGRGGQTSPTQGYPVLGDIWHSRDGVNWDENFVIAPFGDRSSAHALSYDGRLWVLGGINNTTEVSEILTDVWSTTDGLHWIENSGDPPFAEVHHAFALAGKMWVIDAASHYWNSTDGTSWTQVTATPSQILSPYVSISAGSSDRVWLRTSSSLGYKLYSSTDGLNWADAGVDFSQFPMEEALVLATDRFIWLYGGIRFDQPQYALPYTNETWFSSGGSEWSRAAGATGMIATGVEDLVDFHGQLWQLSGLDRNVNPIGIAYAETVVNAAERWAAYR